MTTPTLEVDAVEESTEACLLLLCPLPVLNLDHEFEKLVRDHALLFVPKLEGGKLGLTELNPLQEDLQRFLVTTKKILDVLDAAHKLLNKHYLIHLTLH